MTQESTSCKLSEADNPNYALSEDDIYHLLEGKINIIPYSKIHLANSVTELMNPHDACIILYESKPNYGHWCALLRVNNSEVVEFFDPYGCEPDSQLDYIDKDFRKKTNQEPYLSELLEKYYMNENGIPSYNDIDFQKLAPKIKTCGRWCVLRVALKCLSLPEFQKIVDIFKEIFSFNNKDELVSLLTSIDFDGFD